ncbi:GNAT family N-acetyltransferase [Mycoplasmatota bacterium WC30]
MFETNRLIIRKFKPEDVFDLYNYLSKSEVVKYEPYNIYSLEAAKKEAIRRSSDNAFLGVVLKENNVLIGNLYYELNNKEFNTWEIGYVFNSDYQNQGYATESVKKLIDIIFKKHNAHRIVAFCNVLNTSSWKLLERLNFRREAHRLQNGFFKKDKNDKPIWFDSYEYALLSTEYYQKRI